MRAVPIGGGGLCAVCVCVLCGCLCRAWSRDSRPSQMRAMQLSSSSACSAPTFTTGRQATVRSQNSCVVFGDRRGESSSAAARREQFRGEDRRCDALCSASMCARVFEDRHGRRRVAGGRVWREGVEAGGRVWRASCGGRACVGRGIQRRHPAASDSGLAREVGASRLLRRTARGRRQDRRGGATGPAVACRHRRAEAPPRSRGGSVLLRAALPLGAAVQQVCRGGRGRALLRLEMAPDGRHEAPVP